MTAKKSDKPGQFTTEVWKTKLEWFTRGKKKAMREMRKGFWFVFALGVLVGFTLAAIMYA